MTVLGKKLNNPYSVVNMRRAYDNLRQKSQLKSDLSITTTDYYVRFFPKSTLELETLEADSLPLFDYPLDYEILQVGDQYDDPEVNEQNGQWYYTSVPVDYGFPDIEYEILEELYLPESVEEKEGGRKTIGTEALYAIEDEALRITGNYTALINDQSSRTTARKIAPKGEVMVYDTERGKPVGVEGVRVRTRRWFSYGYAWTDKDGKYTINREYRKPVHYSILFENISGFKIRPSVTSLWKAKHYVGKHDRKGYDFDIRRSSRAWRFCTVNNAVVKYRKYCDVFGTGKPHGDLRLVASKRDGSSATPMLKHFSGAIGLTSKQEFIDFIGIMAGIPATLLNATFFKLVVPDIIIKTGGGRGTASVYETAFHELAHASHYKKTGNAYWSKYIRYIVTYGAYGDGTGNFAGLCALSEAWAYHAGYRLVLEEFRHVGGADNSVITWNGLEDFTPLETGNKDDDIKTYYDPTNPDKRITSWLGWIPAGIMNDIVDNDRDFIRTGFWDDVAGYTHQDLFDALDKDVDTPQKFKGRLLSENGNRDQADLEELFEAYYWN